MRKLFACLSAVVMLLTACQLALAAEEYSFAIVNADRVNLRKSPGGNIITRLDKNACVYIADTREARGKTWHRVVVSVNNDQQQYEGWMDASFLTDVSDQYSHVVQAAVGNRHVLLRMEDGSVAAFGFPFRDNLDVQGWAPVQDIAAARFASFGLGTDGLHVYNDGWTWQNAVEPLVSLHGSSTSDCISGVTASGAFVTTEQPFLGGGWYVPFDETMLADGCIIDAATTMSVLAVITEDHALHVAVEADYIDGVREAEGLQNVRAAACGNRDVYALMTDGTVRCFGTTDQSLLRRAASWQNVEAIAAGNGFVAALMEDGTVSFAGSMAVRNWNYRVVSSERRINLQDEGLLADWTDIVSIAAGDHILVGVTADGHIRVAAAYDYE